MNLRRLALPLVVVIALAAHACAIADGFVFDDGSAVTHNPTVTGPLSLTRLVHHDFWGRAADAPSSVGTWRPLPTLTFFIDWHAGGGRPAPFHAMNLLWHALAVAALFLALRRATGDERLAGVAAALWAILAVNSEAVDSIVGRADVMAAAFGFVAWWLWRKNVAAAALAYVAACLCKESAIVLPAWLALVEHLLAPRNERRRPTAWLALAAAGVAYGVARSLVFHPFGPVPVHESNNPLVGASPLVRAWTGMRLLVLTLRVILVPLNLAPDYSGWDLPVHGFAWEPLAGLVALALLVGGAVALRTRRPAVSAGIALFLVTWGMVSNIAVLLPTIFAERLLYLPSAGVALVIAAVAVAAWPARRALVAGALGLFALVNVAIGVDADRRWHDQLRLFAAAVEVSPGSPRAWLNYAVELQNARRLDEAIAAYRESLRLGLASRTLAGLGAALDDHGDFAEAARVMDAAARMRPDDAGTVQNLAIYFARHRRYADALRVLRPWVAAHPGDGALVALLHRIEQSAAAP